MRKRQLLILPLLLSATLAMQAQRVTINCHNRAAEAAFKELMTQSGKNFIYPAGLLKGVRVTVTARNEELRTVLNRMFSGTGITYTIRGNNVVLKRDKKKASTQPKKKTAKAPEAPKSVTISGFVREKKSGEALTGATVHDPASGLYTQTNATGFYSLQTRPGSLTLIASYPGFDADTVSAGTRRNVNFSLREGGTALNEVVVTADKNRSLTMESPSIGALNLSRADILATPALLGESDVIKTLQLQPGVSAGVEGLAGMYVHGGNADENLYTLDNVPLYQVNHFGGLFSAFNTEAIRTVDFYKSSFPAKFDSRLSSYMDVHTRDGNMEKFSGSFKLGLTSGALSLEGPIWKGHTSYSVAVRRSWYDVFTVPVLAIVNARKETDTKTIFRYAFTDVNAKINHRFSDTSRAYVMFYYGNDFLKGGSEDKPGHYNYYYEKEVNTLSWGNTVASAGWQYTLTPTLLGQLTASYSHYGSSMKRESKDGDVDDKGDFYNLSVERLRSSNNIDDISARLDFDWRPGGGNNVQFGASYIWHTFLPQRAHRSLEGDEYSAEVLDEGRKYRASQWDFYLSDDWQPLECLRLDGGLALQCHRTHALAALPAPFGTPHPRRRLGPEGRLRPHCAVCPPASGKLPLAAHGPLDSHNRRPETGKRRQLLRGRLLRHQGRMDLLGRSISEEDAQPAGISRRALPAPSRGDVGQYPLRGARPLARHRLQGGTPLGRTLGTRGILAPVGRPHLRRPQRWKNLPRALRQPPQNQRPALLENQRQVGSGRLLDRNERQPHNPGDARLGRRRFWTLEQQHDARGGHQQLPPPLLPPPRPLRHAPHAPRILDILALQRLLPY